MPKSINKQNVSAKTKTPVKRKALYTLMPWSCQHYDDRSELKAYVAASGVWETVAEVRRTAGASAETMATYLMHIVNEQGKTRELISNMIMALEMCLICEGLTWEAEREAEITVRRAKEIIESRQI